MRRRDFCLGLVAGADARALCEACDFIRREPRQSAEIYVGMTNEKRSGPAEIERMIADPDNAWTTTPQNAMRYVAFMHTVGTLKKLPSDWKDMFMPESHGLAGS